MTLPATSLREIPHGTSHAEYVMEQAIEAFMAGDLNAGISNLSHAWLIAITKKERVSEERALDLMRQAIVAGRVRSE